MRQGCFSRVSLRDAIMEKPRRVLLRLRSKRYHVNPRGESVAFRVISKQPLEPWRKFPELHKVSCQRAFAHFKLQMFAFSHHANRHYAQMQKLQTLLQSSLKKTSCSAESQRIYPCRHVRAKAQAIHNFSTYTSSRSRNKLYPSLPEPIKVSANWVFLHFISCCRTSLGVIRRDVCAETLKLNGKFFASRTGFVSDKQLCRKSRSGFSININHSSIQQSICREDVGVE